MPFLIALPPARGFLPRAVLSLRVVLLQDMDDDLRTLADFCIGIAHLGSEEFEGGLGIERRLSQGFVASSVRCLSGAIRERLANAGRRRNRRV